MIFKLSITDLTVYMRIGLYNWERVLKQKVLLSAVLSYQKREIVDYAILSDDISKFLLAREYIFLEEAASDLIDFIFDKYPTVSECSLDLSKPMASFMRCAKVSVMASSHRHPA